MFNHSKFKVDKKRFKNHLNRVAESIFSPKVDTQAIDAQLAVLKSSMPIPLFWLFGKAQAGKTSIIKTLTNQSDIAIGNGFEACTKSSQKYAFPSSTEPFIEFLDTKGLGEVDYDPSEDIAMFEQKSQMVMVVIKALDHNLHTLLENLQKISKNKNYPIVVVQTNIHEGYEDIDMEHIEPYPFDSLPFQGVPQNLSRSILKQRESFKEYGIDVKAFVVVDFTQEGDGYSNRHYGLEALWNAIEDIFPYGIRAFMMSSFSDIYAAKAHPHIITHAILAGGSEMIPVPMASIPIVTSIQAKMFNSIASIYNQKLSKKIVTELSAALGTSFLLSLLGRQVVKLIPIYGSVFNAVYSGAVTYALGRLLCIYLNRTKEGAILSEQEIRTLFKTEFEKGKKFLKPYMASLKKS